MCWRSFNKSWRSECPVQIMCEFYKNNVLKRKLVDFLFFSFIYFLCPTSKSLWNLLVKLTFCRKPKDSQMLYKKPSCRQDSRPYCQKLQGSRDLGHAHFQGNYLCACSAFPIQSRLPNLKSLAQVVFEILHSKHIGVTNLTFQGHMTLSFT